MKQLTLFDPRRPDKYPESPGYKTPGTSKDAAKAIAPVVDGLRLDILRELQKAPGTPDEVASRLGISFLSTRPRFTELSMSPFNAIVPTEKRRVNASGKLATVWTLRQGFVVPNTNTGSEVGVVAKVKTA